MNARPTTGLQLHAIIGDDFFDQRGIIDIARFSSATETRLDRASWKDNCHLLRIGFRGGRFFIFQFHAVDNRWRTGQFPSSPPLHWNEIPYGTGLWHSAIVDHMWLTKWIFFAAKEMSAMEFEIILAERLSCQHTSRLSLLLVAMWVLNQVPHDRFER